MEQLVNKVEIVFEKESAIFHDGDHVTGMLLIDNNEDIAYKCKFYFLSLLISLFTGYTKILSSIFGYPVTATRAGEVHFPLLRL